MCFAWLIFNNYGHCLGKCDENVKIISAEHIRALISATSRRDGASRRRLGSLDALVIAYAKKCNKMLYVICINKVANI